MTELQGTGVLVTRPGDGGAALARLIESVGGRARRFPALVIRGAEAHQVLEAELDAGGNLPRIPPMRFGGGLHYHSESWNASAEVRWVDDQTDVAVNETPTDSYTMVNASLGYRLLLSNQIVDILLRGRNLTDEEARSHTSFLKNVAPLPGRNVTLSLRFQF